MLFIETPARLIIEADSKVSTDYGFRLPSEVRAVKMNEYLVSEYQVSSMFIVNRFCLEFETEEDLLQFKLTHCPGDPLVRVVPSFE